MEAQFQKQNDSEFSYISTGHLPAPEQVNAFVVEAYERYEANTCLLYTSPSPRD